MNCLEVIVEFVAVQHEIILTGLPEADIHIAVFHSDFTLFEGFSKTVRALSGQEIFDFGIFFGSKCLIAIFCFTNNTFALNFSVYPDTIV